MPCTGLILAGGQSRRFGQDKAQYRIAGQRMIARVYDTVKAVVPEVWISVRADTPPYLSGVHHLPDVYPNIGPIAGLQAGLSRLSTPWILMVASDLPFLTPETLHPLLAARTPTTDAVIARPQAGPRQPLCGCYHRRILPTVEHQIHQKRYALHALLDHLVVQEISLPAPPLRNINSLRDLEDFSLPSPS